MRDGPTADRGRATLLLAMLVGLSAALAACTTGGEVVIAKVPDDYRLRHPITIREANRSIEIFVGRGRGGLSPTQRADVIDLGRMWVRQGTGAIVADVPIDTPNARAAAATFSEVRALLAASGVPARGITLRRYHPGDPQTFPTITLTYPRIVATAGPCGQWPDDLGPSILDRDYMERGQYYNFGCASQRNLAAMVENPADLVQPRPETEAYTARRSAAFERYRKGESVATSYPEAEKAKLSDTGK